MQTHRVSFGQRPPCGVAAVAALALLLCHCRSISPSPLSAQPSPAASPFTVLGEGIGSAVLDEVRLAALSAQRDVEVWGELTAPVLIYVHPSHRALEREVGLGDVPWLRAWAQYDRIDLQSPTTFGHRDYRPPLRELLGHELTHVFMYQRIGTRETWNRIGIPFWFREGMASWTSHQGYRRGNLFTVGRRLQARHQLIDPLLEGELLNRIDQPLAYAAAHWAFDRLVVEVGEAAVLELLDDIRLEVAAMAGPASASSAPSTASAEGAAGDAAPRTADRPFARAFARRIGMSEAEFATSYRQSLLAAAASQPSS
ncbi:MAG: hypothetical protein JXR83_03305 [Deltaproteobacteria bacterium]|nr:hypothetical protein [Deltaproteobacteria bacterium]